MTASEDHFCYSVTYSGEAPYCLYQNSLISTHFNPFPQTFPLSFLLSPLTLLSPQPKSRLMKSCGSTFRLADRKTGNHCLHNPIAKDALKKTPNDAVTPQRQSQFTPKMKANAVPRLLSSLV